MQPQNCRVPIGFKKTHFIDEFKKNNKALLTKLAMSFTLQVYHGKQTVLSMKNFL